MPRSWSGCPSPYPRDEGLAELFAKLVVTQPEAVAVRMGANTLTYADLDRRANRLAGVLRARGVDDEAAVGVMLGQSIELIVVQVAIVKAGGSFVPLDPEWPADRIGFVLEDACVRVVVSDEEHRAHVLGGSWSHVCLDRDASRIEASPDTFVPSPLGAEHRTHVLYTSGSTGKPKGAEIVARAISRLVLGTDYVQIGPADRVAQLASCAFDAAIFEIWGPLLNGGCTVLLPKATILDPHAFRAMLRDEGIRVMFLTTALFNFTAQACPDAFASLRCLLVGGERANPKTMESVLQTAPPETFLHVYGPTESTTFATAHVLDLDEVRHSTVAIGQPISNTEVFILSPDGKPVAVGESGELYVGGDGLARGYLGRPELTREKFLTLSLHDRTTRVYRTGDLAMFRSDGAIEFLGRTDFQVKIRGYRIELEEVEAALRADADVSNAAIAVHEGASGDRSLVAHVVPIDSARFQRGRLVQRLRGRLPAYMVPSRFLVVDELPLNANGKVDRRALAAVTAEVMSARSSDLDEGGRGREELGDADTELGAIWSAILEIASPALDDDFFDLGGTSLLAARLMLRLRETYGIEVPVYALYRMRTLRGFTEIVRAARRGETLPDGRDEALWCADTELPPDLVHKLADAVQSEPSLAHVLLTGATGFLGAFLLRDLLVRTSAKVSCLVRAETASEGMARIRMALQKYDLWKPAFARRVHAIAGRLDAPRFGLSEADYERLAGDVDVVFHNAAQVSYVQPYASHKASNVDGVLEILRFAAHGRLRPVHYVSTIAVFGPAARFAGRTRVLEDEDLDAHVEGLRFDIGYAQSKWVAEKLLSKARAHGALVSVYRPGFIMGDSQSGTGNIDDFMARLVKGCIQIGAYPELAGQRKEFVPVDYVSSAMLEIALQPETLGGAYHLVPPRAEESILLDDFFELLRAEGYELEPVSYAEWVERLLGDESVEDNALYPLIPMLSEKVHDRTTRWELYADMPAYDASATVAALGEGVLRFRPMDRALLAKYVAHWVRVGFLEGASPASRQVA